MNWSDTVARKLYLFAYIVLTGCAGSVLNPQIFPEPPSRTNVMTGSRQHVSPSDNSTRCNASADQKQAPYCESLLAAREGLANEHDRGDKLIQAYWDAVRYQSSTPAMIAGATTIGAGYTGWRAAAHGTENSNPLLAPIALIASALSFNNVTYSEPRILTYLAGIKALACLRENYAGDPVTDWDANDLQTKLDTLQSKLCRLRHQRGIALERLGYSAGASNAAPACPASADDVCQQDCQKQHDALHSAIGHMIRAVRVTDAGNKMNCDQGSSSDVIKFCRSYSRAAGTRTVASPSRKVLQDSVAASDALIATAEAVMERAQRIPAAIKTNTQKFSRGIHDVSTAVSVQVASTVPKPESVQQAFQSVSVALPAFPAGAALTQQGSKSRARNDEYALQGPLAPAAEAVREAIAALKNSLARVDIGDGTPKQSCSVSRPGAFLTVLPPDRVKDVKPGDSMSFHVFSGLDRPAVELVGGNVPREALTISSGDKTVIASLKVPNDARENFHIDFRDGAGTIYHRIEIRVLKK